MYNTTAEDLLLTMTAATTVTKAAMAWRIQAPYRSWSKIYIFEIFPKDQSRGNLIWCKKVWWEEGVPVVHDLTSDL